MEAADLIKDLESIGYTDVRLLPGRGFCGLHRLIFTTGIVYGLDEYSYRGRFCYHTRAEALAALNAWDGSGDPPGNWIVNKGERGGDRYRLTPMPQEDWDKINPQPTGYVPNIPPPHTNIGF